MNKKKNRIQKNDLNKIIIYILLILFFLIGFSARVNNKSDIIWDTTPNFFFKKTIDLYESGSYPKIDDYSYYPLVDREDYPPFLSIFSVYVFYVIKPFGVDIEKFIVYFPVFMYALIFVIGYLTISRIFNRTTAFFFASLFSIMPISKLLTSKTYYTTEALGVLLIIISSYYFLTSKDKKVNTIFCIISLTMLILTWQIFLFLVVGMIFFTILKIKLKNERKRLILILLSPLILSYIIPVYLLGMEYSSLSVTEELITGFNLKGSQDYSIAFHRIKLKPITFDDFLFYYTPLSFIFIIVGLYVCFDNIKNSSYLFYLIIGAIGLISIMYFVKYRFFALIGILALTSIGLDRFVNIFREPRKTKIIIILILSFSLLIFFSFINNIPHCSINIIPLNKQLRINNTYNFTFEMLNNGKDAYSQDLRFNSNPPFSGVHLGVENADIISINFKNKTYPPFDPTEVKIDWFEATSYSLKKGELIKGTFEIIPRKLPINIYYRCWIPKKCNLKPPDDMNMKYRAPWRNEKCIERTPKEGDICKVNVYAGYKTKRDFPCFNMSFS